jgi:hypothetical protein
MVLLLWVLLLVRSVQIGAIYGQEPPELASVRIRRLAWHPPLVVRRLVRAKVLCPVRDNGAKRWVRVPLAHQAQGLIAVDDLLDPAPLIHAVVASIDKQ